MSTNAIVEDLKQSSITELEFVKQLRKGMCTILDSMEVECYRRGEALGELEEGLRDEGHSHQSTEDLIAEVQALKSERAVLCEEIKVWRLEAAATHSAAQQNGTPAGLSNRRKKALVRIINTAISRGNDAHIQVEFRAKAMEEEAATDETTIFNMTDAEQKSVELKQSLNNLMDMVNESDNMDAAQDLRTAMRRWGDIHRCLVAERDRANKRWDRQNDRTWEVFKEDRALIGERIVDLRKIATELGLDMNHVGEDASM